MLDYVLNKQNNIEKYRCIIKNELKKIDGNLDISFNINSEDVESIFTELFVYNNHPLIIPLTHIYLKNNKFRNKDKIKMLESMKNSYVGLFKVIDVDRDGGYITYQDVFTNKKFKVIDISMSSTLTINKNFQFYTYNRIITFDDISFATGIHCNFTSRCKPLMDFIKKEDYKKCNSFVRCLLLYDIYRKYSDVKTDYNHKY